MSKDEYCDEVGIGNADIFNMLGRIMLKRKRKEGGDMEEKKGTQIRS